MEATSGIIAHPLSAGMHIVFHIMTAGLPPFPGRLRLRACRLATLASTLRYRRAGMDADLTSIMGKPAAPRRTYRREEYA